MSSHVSSNGCGQCGRAGGCCADRVDAPSSTRAIAALLVSLTLLGLVAASTVVG